MERVVHGTWQEAARWDPRAVKRRGGEHDSTGRGLGADEGALATEEAT